MDREPYKYCAVPMCKNSTLKTPNKIFIRVPYNPSLRSLWYNAASVTSSRVSSRFFCEDHFDLPNDMANYLEFYMMGSVSTVRLRRDCVPTKFDCQGDRREGNSNKLRIEGPKQKEREKYSESRNCECVSSGDNLSGVVEPEVDNNMYTSNGFDTFGYTSHLVDVEMEETDSEDEIQELSLNANNDKKTRNQNISLRPYQTCFVPNCENDSIKNPEKVFVDVPRRSGTKRKKWFRSVNRRYEDYDIFQGDFHCCEDHFDKSKDQPGYFRWYKVKGSLKAHKGIIPYCSKNEMDPDLELQRKQLVEEIRIDAGEVVQELSSNLNNEEIFVENGMVPGNQVRPYQTCFVPHCKNDSIKNPEKVFVVVPKQFRMRRLWFESVNWLYEEPNENLHCCEDHFDKRYAPWTRFKERFRPNKGVIPIRSKNEKIASHELQKKQSVEGTRIDAGDDVQELSLNSNNEEIFVENGMVLENQVRSYQTCFVPNCKNDSIKNPEKVFVVVPKQFRMRRLWFESVNRRYEDYDIFQGDFHCCEDHFDKSKDEPGYLTWFKVKGSLKAHKGIIPYCSKNEMDPDLELQRKQLVEEIRIDAGDDAQELSSNLNNEEIFSENGMVSGNQVISNRPYQTCFVPHCKNDSIKNPEKGFVVVPRRYRLREKWFSSFNRRYEDYDIFQGDFHCCEDHCDKRYAPWTRLKDRFRPNKGVLPIRSKNEKKVGQELQRKQSVEGTRIESDSPTNNRCETTTESEKLKESNSLRKSSRHSNNMTRNNSSTEGDLGEVVDIKFEPESDGEIDLTENHTDESCGITVEIFSEESDSDEPSVGKPGKQFNTAVKTKEFQIDDVKFEVDDDDYDEPAQRQSEISVSLKSKNSVPPDFSADLNRSRVKSFTTVTFPTRITGCGFLNVFSETSPNELGPSKSCSPDSTANLQLSIVCPRDWSENLPVGYSNPNRSNARKRKYKKKGEAKSSNKNMLRSRDESGLDGNEDSNASFLQYLKTLLKCCNDKESSEFQGLAMRWFLDTGIVGREAPKN